MFIQTELTPNPNSLKFIPGCPVLGNADFVEFTSKEEAKKSSLAEALFEIENVQEVFFGADFITIRKNTESHWEILKPEILVTIMDHFVLGKPILKDQASPNVSDSSEEDSEIVKQIKEILDTRIRPAVAMDGGDIVFAGFEDGIVKLQLKGACSGCPSSTVTLKDGIENMLKHYIPEVISVESI